MTLWQHNNSNISLENFSVASARKIGENIVELVTCMWEVLDEKFSQAIKFLQDLANE